jgi:hypothetical protein
VAGLRERDQGVTSEVVQLVSVSTYKIQEIVQPLFTEEWDEGWSLIERDVISGGLTREISRCDF